MYTFSGWVTVTLHFCALAILFRRNGLIFLLLSSSYLWYDERGKIEGAEKTDDWREGGMDGYGIARRVSFTNTNTHKQIRQQEMTKTNFSHSVL